MFLIGGVGVMWSMPDTPQDRIDPVRYRNSLRVFYPSMSFHAIGIVGLIASVFIAKPDAVNVPPKVAN